jgi:hypothetical protein
MKEERHVKGNCGLCCRVGGLNASFMVAGNYSPLDGLCCP